MKRRPGNLILIGFLVSLVLLLFQNCGHDFKAIDDPHFQYQPSKGLGSTPTPSPTPTPSVSPSATPSPSPSPTPTQPVVDNSEAITVTGYGHMTFSAPSTGQIIGASLKLKVPPAPPPTGTLFLWPGLQPYGANYLPIGNGVLQPVLTWGPSCAPGVKPQNYSSWWISAQYVNTFG